MMKYDENKLLEELETFIEKEKIKIKESVKEHIDNNNHSGLAQMIGRRYGHIWEKIVSIILKNTNSINYNSKIFYYDFVKYWLNINKNLLENDCCKESSQNLLLKFLSENTGTKNQDLCDFTFNKSNSIYAVDTKFKFNSNDSNTVREISNSAIYLKEMGYIPILLMRRNESESQQSPIKRFKKSGWNIISGQKATKYLYELTGFDIEQWIKNNMNIWDFLKDYQEQLKALRFGESSWYF